MSSNRLSYDTCEYNNKMQESIGQLSYIMDPIKYENNNKCRMELGLVGGQGGSIIKGNMVDLENDLRGQTRPMAQPNQCPDMLYHPSSGNTLQISQHGPNSARDVDMRMNHLPACQMIRYRSTPLPPQLLQHSCSSCGQK